MWANDSVQDPAKLHCLDPALQQQALFTIELQQQALQQQALQQQVLFTTEQLASLPDGHHCITVLAHRIALQAIYLC